MTILTQRDLIKSVPERWNNQYAHQWHYYPQARRIYDELLKLDLETVSAEEVDKLLGNGGWTKLLCNECDKHSANVITFAGNVDVPNAYACLCFQCVVLFHTALVQKYPLTLLNPLPPADAHV